MTVRSELETIAGNLVRMREIVRKRMNTSTADQSDALFLQILEINHRLAMINQLLFVRATDDLSDEVQRINDSLADIEEAIEDLEGIRRVVGAVRNVLGIVDSVIGLLT